MSFIYNILNHRRAGFVVLFIVLIVKIIQFIYFLDTRDDISHMVISAQSFLKGYAIGEPIISASDLSAVHYPHQVKWPPGYSILIAPLIAACQGNYLVAVFIMYVLSSFCIALICRSILCKFTKERFLVNLFTLLTGISLFYFQTKPDSDAVAASFYLLAIYFTISVIKNKSRYKVNFAGMGAALLLSASVKYLYIPLVFLLPLFLIIVACKEKNKKVFTYSLSLLIILFLVIGSILLWQKTESGTVAYVQQKERGLYFHNLVKFHAFIPNAFIKQDTVIYPFTNSDNIQRTIIIALQLFHILAFIFMVRLAFHLMKKNGSEGIAAKFIAITLLISTGIVMVLGTLSVFVAPEKWDNGQVWTYIEEPRYYALSHILIIISGFILYATYKQQYNRKAGFILLLLVLILLPETFRGFVFFGNRMVKFRSEEYAWQKELRFQKFTKAVVDQKKKELGLNTVVLAGSSDWMMWKAALYTRHPNFGDVYKLNVPGGVKTTKPVLLVFILRHSEKALFQNFTGSFSKYYAGKFENFDYYTVPFFPK